jgi:Mg2+-importing ATPase
LLLATGVSAVLKDWVDALVIRTRRPFFKSRPGRYLLIAALIIAGVTVVLPYSPLSGLLGFTPLPISLLLVLGGIAVLYIATSEVAKKVFYERVRIKNRSL